MSKKRGKSASGPSGPTKWETALQSTALNEEGVWEACTALVLGNHLEDESFISILGQTIHGGSRKLFSFFSYEDLMKTVMEFGNPKGKRGKDAPANFEVCEPCKSHLDAGEEIPLPLLAKLVKFRLLWVKADDQRRREAEKKAAEGGGKGGKGSAKGKGGGKKEPEPPSVKEPTKMFKRGEPDPSAVNINDEPDDGVQHYIVMTGFTHPQLLPYLAEVGVCPDLVVKFRAQDYSVFRQEKTDDQLEKEQDEKYKALEEERRAKETSQRAALAQFWLDVRLVLQGSRRLRDVALFDYRVDSLLVPKESDEPEAKAKFGAAMFDDMAELMYAYLDKRRQWRTYLAHQQLLPVPEAPSATPAAGDQEAKSDDSAPAVVLEPVDMRHYNELLDGLPDECISPDTVLHAVLDQVEAQAAGICAPSEQAEPPRQDGVSPKLARLLGTLALSLALTDEEKQLIEAELLPQDAPAAGDAARPLLVHPHDDISLRTHFLRKNKYFVPKDAEMKLLDKLGPLSRLRPPSLEETGVGEQRLARLQELLFFCSQGGLSFTDIDHAFKQFVFEYLQLTLTDARGYVLAGPPADCVIPWDDPYPLFDGLRSIFEAEEQQLSARSSEELRQEEAASPESPRPQSAHSGASQESDGSRQHSGILRRSDSPARSRASSVHFTEEAVEKSFRDSPAGSPPPQRSNDDVVDDIRAARLRDLEEFCYAEHLEPSVLLQVLRHATHQLPYADVYYHQRDSSLFVVLHNPHSQDTLSNHREWHCWLHSNVGLRDFIEYVQLGIGEWIKEMDALYEAQQLRGEVEQGLKEEEEAAKKAEAEARRAGGGGGKAKGKAAAGRSRSNSRSRDASADAAEKSPEEAFIRDGSLKAWKLEQERVQREKEEEERKKAEKRGRSAQKKAEAADKAAGGAKKSRGSAKGRRSGSQSPEKDERGRGDDEEAEKEEGEQADQQQFVSYDLGDTLAHVSGEVTNMFPADGGTIRCERVDFVQGGHSVRTCVFKDGHVITVHVADPVREVMEKYRVEPPPLEEHRVQEVIEELGEASGADAQTQQQQDEQQQQQQPVSYFGSFTARLSDGLTLALSHYGPDGEPADARRPEPQPYTPPAPPRDPSPEPETKSSAKAKKGRASAPEQQTPTQQPEAQEQPPQAEEQLDVNAGFQRVFLSTPDGALVSFSLEGPDREAARLAVKMEFPGQPRRGQHEPSRRAQFDEFSRVVTMDGAVVRTLRDGGTEILYSDGSVSRARRLQQPAHAGDEDEVQKKGESPRKSGKKSKASDFASEAEAQSHEKVEWTHVAASGQCWRLPDEDGAGGEELPALKASRAKDPSSGEVMYTREDKVSIVTWEEAQVTVVEHADGTRMTSFSILQPAAEVPRDAETGEAVAEASDSSPAAYETLRCVRVECAGFPALLLNQSSGEAELTIAGARANSIFAASPVGIYHLFHSEGGQISVHEDGTVMYTPRTVPETAYQLGAPAGEATPTYSFRHHADIVCEVVDPEGNVFSVDTSGNSHVVLSGGAEEAEEAAEEATEEADERNEEAAIAAASPRLQAGGCLHQPRFFTVRSDGSGTELLRYADVAEYVNEAERSPDAAVLVQQLQDSPHVTAQTIIRPLVRNRSQQWTLDYVQDTIVPKGLRSRDLRSFPAPKDDGLAVKQRQQQQQQQEQLQLQQQQQQQQQQARRLGHCDAVEFRQILRFPPVNQETRQQLLQRLQQYAEHVQSRLAEGADCRPEDPRSADERARAAELLSQLAQLQAEAQMQDVEAAYQKATAPAPPEEPPTPKSKRTEADWERDRRELEEEMAHRLALKRKTVPNYFRSQYSNEFLLSQASDLHSLAKKFGVFPPSEASSEQPSRAQSAKDEQQQQQQQQAEQQQQEQQQQQQQQQQQRDQEAAEDSGQQGGTVSQGGGSRFEAAPYYSRRLPAQLLTDDEKQVGGSGVRIPAYLRSGRPNASPNSRQAAIEDPVRRKIFSSSVVGSSMIGQLALRRMRGINALPVRLDFGLLREGCTYALTLHLVNTGVESCRWRLVAPPPATGIRLLYEAGPIAAGMRREVSVEVYAIAAGVEGSSGVGELSHQLQLVTETDVLRVPVTARVMTAHEYDRQDGLRLSRGVRLTSTKPPDRDGIIRPRRADTNVSAKA